MHNKPMSRDEFKRYLARTNLTYEKVAGLLGVSRITAARWGAPDGKTRISQAAADLLRLYANEHPRFILVNRPKTKAAKNSMLSDMLREVIRHLESDTTT